MKTCQLPRGHGCGDCDTCRLPDGSYAAGPTDRFFFWLSFWAVVLMGAALIGGGVSLLTGWGFLMTAGAVVGIVAVLMFLLAALG